MEKVVLITGISSGIGSELKNHFIKDGYTVLGISRNNLETQTNFRLDITNREEVKKVILNIKERYGKIDILINNAGYGIMGATEYISDEEVKKIFDVNFFSALNLTREVLKIMPNEGKIINISSICALFPLPYRSLYCASKSALTMISECLNIELYKSNIQVTNICPGEIKTNFMKNRITSHKTSERYGNSIELSLKAIDDRENKRMPLIQSTKKIYKIVKKKKLKPRYIIGNKYKILYFLNKILPISLIQTFIRKIFLINK